jgi:hypothetical protein
MRHLRSRRSIVLFCIGVVVFAACLPDVSTLVTFSLTPLWVVTLPAVFALLRPRPVRHREQTASLLSLLPTRAPPAFPLFA